MVAAGLGISFNQRLIAQKWDRHAVAQVPFSPPQFIELGIAVPSVREASPAAKKLSACAVRCIRWLTDQGALKPEPPGVNCPGGPGFCLPVTPKSQSDVRRGPHPQRCR